LLEAMSYEVNIIASNIPANLALNLPDDDYFSPQNINELVKKIEDKSPFFYDRKKYNLEQYNWAVISEKTLNVYEKLLL
jgi:glycosyltransferase involved in cell wall biosynthesis